VTGTQTTVHVMRHGEVHNPEKILYGRKPGFNLSDRGRAQAQAVADALAGHDIVAVIASPLERAQQTAAPIAAHHGLSIGTEHDLIESENVFEGERVSPGDGALRNPRNWKYLINPWRPSWGEPYNQVAARMRRALGVARNAGVGHEVVCVSHQLPVEILRRSMLGRRLPHDPRRRMCDLASLNTFVFDGEDLVDWRYWEPAGQ
jgi:broad specificity phosphatase PhoE